ncbi:MAG: tRNA (guanosine(46)-N7)-methyltransferase TrmB [Ginsengibacter sp.]
MGQKKLKRFSEIKSFSNVLEYPENMKGRWHNYFKNSNRIVLELACGKGEYTVGLAKLYPNQNFIGVDIKGNRMWAGAKYALENNLNNASFLRTHIDKIENYFDKEEVSSIWITFPDPQLRKSRAKKRLTHPYYLRNYLKILTSTGYIHLKTDSPDLYEFTKHVISFFDLSISDDVPNVYATENVSEELSIKTHYEKLDIAKSSKIFYLSFALNDHLLDNDRVSAFHSLYKTITPEVSEDADRK